MSGVSDDTMYALGQLARAVFPRGDMPPALHDLLLVRPATGLGRLLKTPAAKRAAQRAAEGQGGDYPTLLAKLPAGIADPPGGLTIAQQGPYWLGWYHFGAALGQAGKYGAAELERAGRLLYGERWQTDLARALGVGDRRVREWVAGDRRPSAGVWADIAVLLRQRQAEGQALLADLGDSSGP